MNVPPIVSAAREEIPEAGSRSFGGMCNAPVHFAESSTGTAHVVAIRAIGSVEKPVREPFSVSGKHPAKDSKNSSHLFDTLFIELRQPFAVPLLSRLYTYVFVKNKPHEAAVENFRTSRPTYFAVGLFFC